MDKHSMKSCHSVRTDAPRPVQVGKEAQMKTILRIRSLLNILVDHCPRHSLKFLVGKC